MQLNHLMLLAGDCVALIPFLVRVRAFDMTAIATLTATLKTMDLSQSASWMTITVIDYLTRSFMACSLVALCPLDYKIPAVTLSAEP